MVLQVRGALTIAERDLGIRRAVRTALDEGTRAFVLDLQGLTLIDSSGVAEIATTHTAIATRGGRFALCNVSEKLKDVFIITRLNTVFETRPTEAEAVAAVAAVIDET